MEEFKPLYKLKDNHKFYQWSIKIINEKEDYYLETSHGQVDGKMVTHRREIVPKSNRTAIEQSNLEASKKWNDKIKKEGYSTELNQGAAEDQDILIRPMLAQKFDKSKYKKKVKKIEFPCYGQPKYDGIRCLMFKKNGKVIMESRKGTEFMNFEVLRNEFLEELGEYDYVFDGELYSNLYPFEKVNGLVRLKKPNKELIDEINTLNYVIYDIINPNNLKMTFEQRYKIIQSLEKNKKKRFKLIEFCETYVIPKLSDVDKFHDKFVEEGFEGLVLRNMNGIYEINKRSYDLQKYKKTMDEEFLITGFTDGVGDEKGLIIFECATEDGKTFNVRPRGSHEYRRELYLKGKSLIGLKLTVIFQEYSKDGIPRFPVGKSIRYDK